MRNVLYFLCFFQVYCSIKGEENTLQNATKGVNRWSFTTRIKDNSRQPSTPGSDSPMAEPETPTNRFISEDYTFEFKGCFGTLTYTRLLWKDGFLTKSLTQNTWRYCFEWCVNDYLGRIRYFAISKEFCQCFNLTFPDNLKTNMSYCGGEACERFGQCNGTSSYVGVYEILDVKTIHGNNREEDERGGSITLSRDLLVAIATPVCCVFVTLVGLIILVIKWNMGLRKELLRNLSTSTEMPTDFEVRGNGITSQGREATTSLGIINNDIYNEQEIALPSPNQRPIRNCGPAVNIELADDVSSDAASSNDYQNAAFSREPLSHRDTSTRIPTNLEVVCNDIRSGSRGTATSLDEISNEIYDYQEIALPPPTPHQLRNVGSAAGLEQTDGVDSDTADNDYQYIN